MNRTTRPRLRGLSEAQIRGFACLRCARPLADDTAVDLPRERLRLADHRFWWCPRVCRDHVEAGPAGAATLVEAPAPGP
ncbi:hypothetical protein [Streptomyces sp. URMC 123]|uniref:hypothetical protein n=1 Tax=Streptomyces sp. URMC 123 TaxID=3423403 RepID=UPI003F1E1908